MATIARLFQSLVLDRAWLTFVVLCSSFGLFGAGTLNLFNMFSSNWDMFVTQGLMAVVGGPVRQLFELLWTLALSMFFYVIFKVCEHSLVNRILHSDAKEHHP
jgi:peptidoglycan/LPS O-acetylase OafA/YrhL